MLKSKLVVLDNFSSTEKLSNACSTRNNPSPSLMSHPNFRIVFEMERSTDDIASFINKIVGSWFTGQTRLISL
jgi:hypothetical protein